ncbi:MAG: hypothetical protein ABI333_11765 [bacterium]
MKPVKRTRRIALFLSLLAGLGLGATVGEAESSARPRGTRKASKKAAKGDQTRFYDFDELLIDGEFRKPATLYTRALKSPRFDRLLRLQKSFLYPLLKTARYPSLRWFR